MRILLVLFCLTHHTHTRNVYGILHDVMCLIIDQELNNSEDMCVTLTILQAELDAAMNDVGNSCTMNLMPPNAPLFFV